VAAGLVVRLRQGAARLRAAHRARRRASRPLPALGRPTLPTERGARWSDALLRSRQGHPDGAVNRRTYRRCHGVSTARTS
jgi:hypothetical protein